MSFRLHALTALICLLLCSCAGKAAAPDFDVAAREQLSITLLDCPSGALTLQEIDLISTSDGQGLIVTLQSNSSAPIQALNCRLRFDPERWQAGQLTPSAAWGAPDASLSLLVEKEPGVADIGIALANWDRQPGISANGAMASVELLPAGTAPRASSSASSPDVRTGVLTIERPAGLLSWTWLSRGDYDLNGEVNISDLTALALHLGNTVMQQAPGGFAISDELPFSGNPHVVADGDLNGIVSIADITSIGQFYGQQIKGFRVYHSDNWWRDYPREGVMPAQHPEFSDVHIADKIVGTASERPRFELSVDESNPRGDYWWVVPFSDAWEGSPSNTAIEKGVKLPRQDRDYQLVYEPGNIGSARLVWNENLLGDYNQNTEINTSDLDPVGLHLGEIVQAQSTVALKLIDGYRDGRIDLKDLHALPYSFGQMLDGFHVFAVDAPEDVPSDPYAAHSNAPLASVLTWEMIGDWVQGKSFEFFPETDLSGKYVWVQPFGRDGTGSELNGVMSEVIQVP